MSDIVVVARTTRNANGATVIQSVSTVSREDFERQQTLEREDESDGSETLAIVITELNGGNRARAEQAARLLIAAIIELNNRLRTKTVSWSVLNHVFSSADTLSDNVNHKREVSNTDVKKSNGGVGTARRGETNTFYYPAIAGDPDHPEYKDRYYGRPGLAGGKGVLAIVLHDLFHMSTIGDAMFNELTKFWRAEVGSSEPRENFHSSPYGHNLEAFANEFVYAAAIALGISEIDRQSFSAPSGFVNPIDPQELFDKRNPKK